MARREADHVLKWGDEVNITTYDRNWRAEANGTLRLEVNGFQISVSRLDDSKRTRFVLRQRCQAGIGLVGSGHADSVASAMEKGLRMAEMFSPSAKHPRKHSHVFLMLSRNS
jgi:hypothetical protein